jgi:hypothetical protein
MKYIYILLICLILFYILSIFFEKYIIQENFDPSLVPVSSIITLAKIAQKMIDNSNTLINPANLQIGIPSAKGNLTVTGTNTLSGPLNVDNGIITNGNISVNNGLMNVGNNTSISGDLRVTGITSISGNTEMNSNLDVTGLATLKKMTIENISNPSNSLNVNNVTINGTSNFRTDRYNISSDSIARYKYETNGNTLLGSTKNWVFKNLNSLQLPNTPSVTINSNGNLIVSGSTTIPNAIIGNSNLPTATTTLTVNGSDTTGSQIINKDLTVIGDSNFSGALNVNSLQVANNDRYVTLGITSFNATTPRITCDHLKFTNAAHNETPGATPSATVTVNGNLKVTGSFNYLPAGTVMMWTGATAPEGWDFYNANSGRLLYGGSGANVDTKSIGTGSDFTCDFGCKGNYVTPDSTYIINLIIKK